MGGPMIDLNCDMGESFGAWPKGDDLSVLRSISSANVACGFHAGDPRVMEQTVRLAAERGVGIGAHPGFPDLVGFGRRDMKLTADEVRTDVIYQLGALSGFCAKFGVVLSHVKPHGQLNNLAFYDQGLAEAIVQGVADFSRDLIVVAYGGWLGRAALAAGLPVAWEVFGDRAYNPDGTLVSRMEEGAVIRDPDAVVERSVRMVQEGRVQARDGSWVEVRADTICVHGDTPGASDLTARIRKACEASGLRVVPMSEVIRGTQPS